MDPVSGRSGIASDRSFDLPDPDGRCVPVQICAEPYACGGDGRHAGHRLLSAGTDRDEGHLLYVLKADAGHYFLMVFFAGFFSSDRTIEEYNRDIWKLN